MNSSENIATETAPKQRKRKTTPDQQQRPQKRRPASPAQPASASQRAAPATRRRPSKPPAALRRKEREQDAPETTSNTRAAGTDKPQRQPLVPAPAADNTARLKALVEKANQGDKAAIAKLREFLDTHPEVWQTCGDIGKRAENTWLEQFAKEVLATECIKRHVEQFRADLAGPRPTAMEQILVNQAVVCYLAVQHAEIAAAQPGPVSVEQTRIRLKRSESASKRMLAALRTLAHLRANLPEGLLPIDPLRLFGTEPVDSREL